LPRSGNMRLRFLAVGLGLLGLHAACSSDSDPSSLATPSSSSSGSSSTSSGGASSTSSTSSGGSSSGDASTGSDAGGDASTLPPYDVITKFGHQIIRVVTVHKNGGEDRTVYVEASKIAIAPTTGVLPDGTRLLMQVNQGSSYVIEKVGGVWQYGTFDPNANPAVFVTGANAGCNNCHNGAAEPGAWTAGSLRRLALTHKGEELNCPMGPGPNPCAQSVYK
jgi:hypothetical protein